MSAQPAPRHRQATRSVPLAAHEERWASETAAAGGYMQVPRSFQHLLKQIAASEMQTKLLVYVVAETMGAKTGGVKPEWAELTETKAGKLAGCSRNAAGTALAALVAIGALNEEKLAGERGRRYTPNIPGWAKCKPRGPRKLQLVVADEDQEEQEDDDSATSMVLKTTEALVILPGKNSKPKLLSQVCPNAGNCELAHKVAGGQKIGEGIASAQVIERECQVELSLAPTPSPEAETATNAISTHLRGIEAAGGRKFSFGPVRPISLIDGVLTVAVRPDLLEMVGKQFAKTPYLPKGVSSLVLAPVAAPSPSPRPEIVAEAPAARLRAQILAVGKLNSPLSADLFETAVSALATPHDLFVRVVAERARKGGIKGWGLLPQLALDAVKAHHQELGLK